MGARIIMPPPLQLQRINYIHLEHQNKTKIGLSTLIENLIRSCPNYVEERTNNKESFVKETLPNIPWQSVSIYLNIKVRN